MGFSVHVTRDGASFKSIRQGRGLQYIILLPRVHGPHIHDNLPRNPHLAPSINEVFDQSTNVAAVLDLGGVVPLPHIGNKVHGCAGAADGDIEAAAELLVAGSVGGGRVIQHHACLPALEGVNGLDPNKIVSDGGILKMQLGQRHAVRVTLRDVGRQDSNLGEGDSRRLLQMAEEAQNKPPVFKIVLGLTVVSPFIAMGRLHEEEGLADTKQRMVQVRDPSGHGQQGGREGVGGSAAVPDRTANAQVTL
ncbi:hypothetical protein AbraIFM66951_011112 [Aspergillus brasiliensis]|uniref:Uncharacterized protein n=1 Tax=Aspergillus brasiliensis TaxID=319629 RepID=A0A9W5YXI7_9EURO|nr:hypothetical protein AbraCBS73388_011139 [Aspergillus brasiliensis]GKZ47558.1 hypothetical protein AbraIFM66951_011112 [Aspergillus brasiliensis]